MSTKLQIRNVDAKQRLSRIESEKKDNNDVYTCIGGSIEEIIITVIEQE